MAPGPDQLSPHGRALLKQLGGNPGQVRPTAAAVARFGADQPDSVLEVIPEQLANDVLRLPDALFALPELELERQAQVSRQDRRMRIQFWEEYEKAHKRQELMDLARVSVGSGVPSWGYYYEKLSRTPALLAWLMQPPAEYKLQMKEGSELGMRRLMDILELPLKNEKGVVNVGIGLLILQAIKMVDQRNHGAITQKVVNVNVDGGKAPEEGGQLSMEEIDKKVKELEQELEAPIPQALHEKPVIEVESTVAPKDGAFNVASHPPAE